MPSSVARLISLDHERLLRLVRRAVAPGPSQTRWRDELVRLLRAHLRAERMTLGADVLGCAGLPSGAADEVARRGRELERLAADLAAGPVPDPRLGPLGDAVTAALHRHSEQLADDVLAPLVAAVRRKEIRDLGGRYQTVRDEALHRQGAEEPPPRRLDLPRAQLYELARRAGVEGRSGMSRSELIAELQRRTGV